MREESIDAHSNWNVATELIFKYAYGRISDFYDSFGNGETIH